MMTYGQRLLLQQIQLVAHARKWDIPKAIKKTQGVLDALAKAHAASVAKEKPAASRTSAQVSPDEAKLIAQAESILKDLQQTGDDDVDESLDTPPSDPGES